MAQNGIFTKSVLEPGVSKKSIYDTCSKFYAGSDVAIFRLSLLLKSPQNRIFSSKMAQNGIFTKSVLLEPTVSKKSIHDTCSKYYSGSDFAIFRLSLLLESAQNRIFSSRIAQNGIFTKSVVLTFSFSQKKNIKLLI